MKSSTKGKRYAYLTLRALGVLDTNTSGRFFEMTLGPLTVTFSSVCKGFSRKEPEISGRALVFLGERP